MGLFNAIGRLFGGGAKTPLTEPAGTDGVAAPGGYLWQGERNRDLIGHRLWLTISDAISNSIVVGAASRYFLNLCAGTTWESEPNQAGGAGAKRGVEIVQQGLFDADMAKPWSSVVRKAALYKFYGFSIHEWIIRQRRDGLIAFAELQHRPQYTIYQWDKPTEQSPIAGVVQQTRFGNQYYVPRARMLYCVDDTLTDDPEGFGMMRHLISHVERVRRYEQLEGIAFETDLRGIPYMRAPIAALKSFAKANGKSAAWLEEQVSTIKSFGEGHVKTADLSIALDSEPYFDKDGHPSAVPKWTMELLKGDGAPLAEVAAAINRGNTEIARVIGAEFMMMGAGTSGSRAMHADKTDQFGNLIQSTLGEIAAFARNDLARTLVSLNGLDADTCTPNLLPGSVATEAVQSVAQSLLFLSQAGAPLMPGDPAIDQIRARMHLAAQPTITPEVGGMLPRTGKPKSDDAIDVDLSDLNNDTTSGLGAGT